MRSHNGSIDTTHTPPPLSFYNTFKEVLKDMTTRFLSLIWSRMGFSFATSFVFEDLSNLTKQLQEKSANHAQ